MEAGDIIDGRWLIGEAIGLSPDLDAPCDAPDGGSYMFADGVMRCRCVVCPRCHHHTGNSHQGHYWAVCKVLQKRLHDELPPGAQIGTAEYLKRTSREFHLCCPDTAFGCELEATA